MNRGVDSRRCKVARYRDVARCATRPVDDHNHGGEAERMPPTPLNLMWVGFGLSA
jgi:hypothetical protein